MRRDDVVRIVTIGLALVAGLCLGAAPGQAATPDGTASLGAANVDITDAGPAVIDPLAPCDVDGQTSGSTAGGSIPRLVSFGSGTTSCTRDTTANTTHVTGSGSRFQLDLTRYGGPRIRLASYQTFCSATTGGTNAGYSFSGLTGISGLPQPIPANYPVQVTATDGTVLATAIFNEIVVPDPNDGSSTLNMIHFTFPAGGPVTGDIYVGSAACAPTF